jgi:hypothetical protein
VLTRIWLDVPLFEKVERLPRIKEWFQVLSFLESIFQGSNLYFSQQSTNNQSTVTKQIRASSLSWNRSSRVQIYISVNSQQITSQQYRNRFEYQVFPGLDLPGFKSNTNNNIKGIKIVTFEAVSGQQSVVRKKLEE